MIFSLQAAVICVDFLNLARSDGSSSSGPRRDLQASQSLNREFPVFRRQSLRFLQHLFKRKTGTDRKKTKRKKDRKKTKRKKDRERQKKRRKGRKTKKVQEVTTLQTYFRGSQIVNRRAAVLLSLSEQAIFSSNSADAATERSANSSETQSNPSKW